MISAKVEIDFVISSANGTFVDQAESQALQEIVPNALVYTGKPALGESVGAAGLWQIILAAQALRSKEIPPVLHADRSVRLRLSLLADADSKRATRDRFKLRT